MEVIGTAWLLCSVLEHWQALATIAIVAAALTEYQIKAD